MRVFRFARCFSARHVKVLVEGDRDGARAVEARRRAGAGRQEPDPDAERRLRAVPAGGARRGKEGVIPTRAHLVCSLTIIVVIVKDRW